MNKQTKLAKTLRNIEEVLKAKYPTTKEHHLGIEIECITNCNRRTAAAHIAALGLTPYVNVGTDGSIDSNILYVEDGNETQMDDSFYALEIRICVPERKLSYVMSKMKRFFKTTRAMVNDSCGLHVHLDMRNRDPDKCYNALVRSQDLLFKMVHPARKDSDYCIPNGNSNYDKEEKYRAINYKSLYTQNTIEVRLHDGSVNTSDIVNWCNTLVTIINSKRVVTERTVGNLPAKLKTYVAKKRKQHNKLQKTYVKVDDEL